MLPCCFEQGQYDGAYYLAGFAVECSLMAVIAKRTRALEFPDLAMVRKSDSWNRVILWTEASRYDTGRKPDEAETLYNEISDPSHGVLSCLSKHW